MDALSRVRELVEPVLADLDVHLYDLERNGPAVQITIDGPEGIGMEVLREATIQISRLIDEHDPVSGTFTLEVSSPGLERKLRLPEHFEGAVGEQVTVKTRTDIAGQRRFAGVVSTVEGDDVVLAVENDAGSQRIPISDIVKARTVFVWDSSKKNDSTTRKASQP